MKKLLIASWIIFLALAVIDCGGGGGGGSTTSPSTPAPVAQNQSASGVWNGSFHSNVTNKTDNISGVFTEGNEIRLCSTTWGGQYAGTGTVSGNSISGTLKAYAPWGYHFVDGTTVGTATLNGTVNSKTSISGTYSGAGDSGTFYVAYDSVYQRASSLDTVKGNWQHSSSQLGTVNMTIDDQGNFIGTTSGGCAYSGKFSIINPSFNAYLANLAISSCGSISGNYSGHAILDDTNSQNDTFIVGVSNSSSALTANFIRGPGGNASPTTVTSPSLNLNGTYSMTGFTVKYSNGATLTEHSSTITSWSGTMKISANSITQSIVMNNTPISLTGATTITWQNSTSGIAHVTEQSGNKHDVSFSISGNYLTTYSGVVQSSTPGLTFEEWDYWVKVSDSLSPELLDDDGKRVDQPTAPFPIWIGEVFNP